MAASATIRKIGDVSIVDLKGRITLGDGSGVIRDTIKDLVAKGERKLLLNLAEVTYIDSAGLGEMVGAYATYVVQNLFRSYLPGAFDYYVLAAMPASFINSRNSPRP